MPVNAKRRPAPAAKAIDRSAIPNLGAGDAAPLYELAKRHMSEAILMGEWTPGTVLPGEVALSRMFGIAVGTVRRALSDLVAEGLLSRRRKTGTVVTGRSPHHSLRYFFQFFRLHGNAGALVVRSRVRMLSCAVDAANPMERDRLELAKGAPVLRLHRVRLVAGRPVMHDRLSIPAGRVPEFPTRLRDVPELVYLHLVERYGIRISAVREQLSAELASAEDRELLALAPPAAVLAISEVAYDQGGKATIFGLHRASTAEHLYVNEVR